MLLYVFSVLLTSLITYSRIDMIMSKSVVPFYDSALPCIPTDSNNLFARISTVFLSFKNSKRLFLTFNAKPISLKSHSARYLYFGREPKVSRTCVNT